MADIVEAFELPDPIGHPPFGQGRMTWIQASAGAGPWDAERDEDGCDDEAGVGHGDEWSQLDSNTEIFRCFAHLELLKRQAVRLPQGGLTATMIAP